MAKSKKSKKSKKPQKVKKPVSKDTPIGLLDLPTEIQLKIYEYHYADSKPELCGYNQITKTFSLTGIPNLQLEQTCHKVSVDARRVRGKTMSRKLATSPFAKFEQSGLRAFCVLDRYSWLRNHIDSLNIFTMHPDDPPNWALLVRSCPRLQEVSIEIFPRYCETGFPEKKKHKEFVTHIFEGVLAGIYDDKAIEMVNVMGTDGLIKALGRRQDDPRVVARVHIVQLLVDRVREREEPCIELVSHLGILNKEAMANTQPYRSFSSVLAVLAPKSLLDYVKPSTHVDTKLRTWRNQMSRQSLKRRQQRWR